MESNNGECSASTSEPRVRASGGATDGDARAISIGAADGDELGTALVPTPRVRSPAGHLRLLGAAHWHALCTVWVCRHCVFVPVHMHCVFVGVHMHCVFVGVDALCVRGGACIV